MSVAYSALRALRPGSPRSGLSPARWRLQRPACQLTDEGVERVVFPLVFEIAEKGFVRIVRIGTGRIADQLLQKAPRLREILGRAPVIGHLHAGALVDVHLIFR